MCGCINVFFFKQKTAYEMRISDWSSDVCSSDLAACDRHRRILESLGGRCVPRLRAGRPQDLPQAECLSCLRHAKPCGCAAFGHFAQHHGAGCDQDTASQPLRPRNGLRSEEHTSELQSLMRISYALFCLKNKK